MKPILNEGFSEKSCLLLLENSKGNQGNRTKNYYSRSPLFFHENWFFVTFGAVHVLKLVSLLQSKVMPALLNICLLIALVLLTVPSKTPLFR